MIRTMQVSPQMEGPRLFSRVGFDQGMTILVGHFNNCVVTEIGRVSVSYVEHNRPWSNREARVALLCISGVLLRTVVYMKNFGSLVVS